MIEVTGCRLALGTARRSRSRPLRTLGLMVTALPTLLACAQAQQLPARPSAPAPLSPTAQVPLTADAHLHILDFLQNGEYLVDGRLVYSSPANTLPAGERGRRIDAVLWAMDEANVSHAIIMGMPFGIVIVPPSSCSVLSSRTFEFEPRPLISENFMSMMPTSPRALYQLAETPASDQPKP